MEEDQGTNTEPVQVPFQPGNPQIRWKLVDPLFLKEWIQVPWVERIAVIPSEKDQMLSQREANRTIDCCCWWVSIPSYFILRNQTWKVANTLSNTNARAVVSCIVKREGTK